MIQENGLFTLVLGQWQMAMLALQFFCLVNCVLIAVPTLSIRNRTLLSSAAAETFYHTTALALVK